MAVLDFAGRLVGVDQPVYIIAEIGQNHQGCLQTAMLMIEEAARAGVDCVKFQKSTLREKYSPSVLARRYDSPNSFGSTYGAHKAFLELTEDDYRALQKKARDCGVQMTASAMDQTALDFLESLEVPFIKIGSGDSNNMRLIGKAAKTGIPLVISTGMSNMETVERIYSLVSNSFGMLQCTSAYPTRPSQVNLNVIDAYRQRFPRAVIGFSGHEESFIATLGAVAKGAKIIERHFTLDKSLKGSDHKCSLDPVEMRTMIEQIRVLEKCLGSSAKTFLDCERPCFDKLGKSIVASRNIRSGTKIAEVDLQVKVAEPHGWNPLEEDSLLKRIATRDIMEGESIVADCVT
ncbi:sialic acid synthase [Galendromus occidentalis]|uniref:Sialic acid synthase n=1 Tax=Galendromus occidentalis TaxID=34638 RepID=A0AAJ6QWN8_9ACAR|nr:sialic acid synthase [Galendromus occidentalis]